MKTKSTAEQRYKLTTWPKLEPKVRKFLIERNATVAEANVFHFIIKYMKKNGGFKPKNKDIREGLNIARCVSVYHCRHMIDKNIIKVENGFCYSPTITNF